MDILNNIPISQKPLQNSSEFALKSWKYEIPLDTFYDHDDNISFVIYIDGKKNDHKWLKLDTSSSIY